MRKKSFCFIVLSILFSQIISAQIIRSEPPIPPAPGRLALAKVEQKTEISAENKKRGIELLRETSQMITTLASPSNRISYSIKTAKVLWKLDERAARETYRAAMEDVRQTVIQTDLEMNRIENAAATDTTVSVAGGEIYTRLNQIFTLRSALVNSLSEDDPEWAFEFLQDTKRLVTNQYLKENLGNNDAYLESSLIGRIAEKNATKALALGHKKLAEGISEQTVSLMQSIYEKDSEKGAAFAEDVLKKIKQDGLSTESSWILMSLFETGVANNEEGVKETPNKKPLFSESSLREIADLLAKQVVDPLNVPENYGLGDDMLASLQKYAPQKSAQLKKLIDLQKAREERDKSPEQTPSKFDAALQKMSESQIGAQGEIARKLEGLSAENVGSEDKKKIIEEARSKISTTVNKNQQLTILISLAAQAANAGEKELADNLLGEAEQLTNPQTREMKDFSERWTLANGYAKLKPEKSFAIVEDTIFRLNDVITAFIKFSEFQSGDAMIENGELKMGDYGGQMFGFSNGTSDLMSKLVEVDYPRVKALADKFDRPEFKVETRLTIAGILIKPKMMSELTAPTIKK